VRALNTVNIEKGFEAGLAIVIVAILLDRLCRQRQRS
jgi:glycine betaine/proline transport system permease protein